MGNFYMESTQINYRRDEKLKTVDQKLQELSETSAIDTDIAPVFKSTNTYQPGDMVYYRNKLYVFNVEHTGAWAAADVTATDVTTEISSLKSGLTNVADDVKLNTQDLTTPSRSINLMSLPITITKSGGSTGTVTNNNGVITLNGEFLENEIITITCANCIAPNDAIIAYMNNVALPSANISFYDGSTKHDYFSLSIPNRVIYTSALVNVVGKTINRYDMTFTTNTTLEDFTFSLMMAHNGQNVSTYVPNIPSVDARLDAVESNNFGTVVDLSAYQQGDKYTCLSDGYAVAYVPANGNVTYRLYGASGSEFIYNSIEASNEQTSVIYVKKGMRLELCAISGTSASFKFYPFAS